MTDPPASSDASGSPSAGGSVGSGLSRSLEAGVPRVSSWRNKRLAKFRLLSLLGQGAMGRVFLAEDTVLHRQVAVKVLAPRKKPGESSSGTTERDKRRSRQFLIEGQAAAALSHPHIVGVHELGQSKGMAYIAMELVDGGDVKRLVDTGGALSTARACDLGADAAEALAFAHGMGVVHRDVKPANLLITRQGRVKLADFGLADPGDVGDGQRLRDGVIGTPACMAPEVAMGGRATPASDQYSLGCTLWHMLTGEALFAGDNPQHILEKHVRAVPPSLADLVPGVPPALTDAIHRSLKKNPAERHASCEAFGRLLRAHAVSLAPEGLSGHGSQTRLLAAVDGPAGRGESAGAWKGSTLALAAVGVVLAAGVVAGLFVWGGGGEPDARPVPDAQGRSVAGPPPKSPDAVDPAATQGSAPAGSPDMAVAPAPPRSEVPVVIVPAPTAEPKTPPGPPPTSTAAAAKLALAVQRGEAVTVAGRLQSVDVEAVDGRHTARFAGAGPNGLVLFWDDAVGEELSRLHGGRGGAGLAGPRGATVRVTGVPEFRFGLPALRIREAEAVRTDR